MYIVYNVHVQCNVCYIPSSSQRLDDTNPQVRDSAMEVLGTLIKALGDRAMNAYLENVDKTKMAKVQLKNMYMSKTCSF